MRATTLAALCLSTAILAVPRSAEAATLSFEALPLGTTTPFSLTDDGVTATFSSPEGPVFFITGTFFSTLSGNVLIDADPPQHALDISFSQPQDLIVFAFGLNGNVASTLTLQTFAGAVSLGSISATGVIPPGFLFPEGSINHTSGTPFDRVRLTSSTIDFAIDNVSVRSTATTVPEPSSLLLVGLGLAGLRCLKRAGC